jgi:hypothetical protein
MLIFVSLVFVLVFSLLVVLTLNYAIYTWENKRVSNLASQIKPTQANLSAGGSFAKNFSSVDLGSSLNKNKALQVAGSIYDRAVVTITKQDYPSWINKIREEFELFRKNAWKSLSRFFNYLIHLTKPVVKTEIEIQPASKDKDPDNEELVNHEENSAASEIQVKSTDNDDDTEDEEIKDVDYEVAAPEKEKDDNLATISFAATTSHKSAADMTIFERLETRILEKLKTSGFDHYDIWLELGSLYEKYDEREKASEVYAFVMKQSEGKEKDLARDKLIGLS